MARYVLSFQGDSPSQADVDLITQSAGVAVVDRTGGTLLVEAPEGAMRDLRERLADWSVAPEATYRRPEPFTERVRDDGSQGAR
jgi:hypothetical protein